MKKPIVAIVGRPNVGKSTLFNRILQKREAIVADVSGVTRDRLSATAEWAGVEFELLDTGGYVPSSEDVFEKAIREQVDYAIHEADVIVFVTDIVTGITSIDEDVAKILKQKKVNVILAVNKVDNELREPEQYVFFKLGLGDPVPVSAISGRRMGDFLDKVIEQLPIAEQVEEIIDEDAIRIAIIGRPNVGKSSYINAILGKEKHIVTDIPGTTRDAVDTLIKREDHNFILVDTAGLRRKARVKENIEYFSNVRTIHALHRCDIAIVLIDATDGMIDQDKKIIDTAIRAGRGVALAVNKWDLIKKDTNTAREFELDFKQNFRDMAYIPIMFISALEKQRIFKLLDLAAAIYQERKKRIQTADLNKFLEDAIEKNHPPAYGDKYVKINYATQTKSAPPMITFFSNEPKGIKKNYKNYLENLLRQQFGFMGVPIRLHFRKKN